MLKQLQIKMAIAAGLLFTLPARAQLSIDIPQNFAGFSSQDLVTTIENIVMIILGFLGIITILIVLWGGWTWMTSLGNEDKIEQAKKLISAGVVGLIVVLASYAIALFVLNSLMQAV